VDVRPLGALQIMVELPIDSVSPQVLKADGRGVRRSIYLPDIADAG